MACYSCGYKGKLKNTKIKMYQYLESGLDNVFLANIPAVKCPECSIEIPVIEKVEQLHEIIAHAIFNKKFLLNGNEIRFLRTQLGYSQKDFAEEIDLAQGYMNRLEKGADPVTAEVDQTIRLNYLRLKGTPKRDYKALHSALDNSMKKREKGAQSLRLRPKESGWNLLKDVA